MPFCFPLTFKVVYTEKRCELAALMVCSELIRNAMSILFDTFTVMLFLYVSVTLVQWVKAFKWRFYHAFKRYLFSPTCFTFFNVFYFSQLFLHNFVIMFELQRANIRIYSIFSCHLIFLFRSRPSTKTNNNKVINFWTGQQGGEPRLLPPLFCYNRSNNACKIRPERKRSIRNVRNLYQNQNFLIEYLNGERSSKTNGF